MPDLYDLAMAERLKRSSGGGGGTTNYNNLSNKPQINSHTLSGNQSSSDLGIVEPRIDSTNGDIYFGSTRIARVMDKDSYDALETKENIYYLTYPTPVSTRETKSEIQERLDEKELENPDIREQLKELIEEPEPDIKNGGDG